MSRILKVIMAMACLSYAQASDIDLDKFFGAAKTRCGFTDDAAVAVFKARYASDVTRLELVTCHKVYQLLGVMAAQYEGSFRDLSAFVLASYGTDKSLLEKLTGYKWGTDLAQGKDAEVASTIQKMQWMRANLDTVHTQAFIRQAAKEKDGSFFQKVVFAVHAKSIFNLSRIKSGDDWHEEVKNNGYDVSNFLSLLRIFVTPFLSCLAVPLAAGRVDLADHWYSANQGKTSEADFTIVVSYYWGLRNKIYTPAEDAWFNLKLPSATVLTEIMERLYR